MNLFETQNYSAYLANRLEREPFGRGSKSKLAEFLGVQVSYVSLILTQRQDLTLEHAIKVCRFLQLSEEETRYFLLLVQIARAGNHDLKTWYKKQLEEIREARSAVERELGETLQPEAGDSDFDEYYKSWVPTAVHMLLRNPEINTVEDVSKTLALPREEVAPIFDLLLRLRLVRSESGKWQALDLRFHLARDSLALRMHHTNWRLESLRWNTRKGPNDLQYTSVMSIDSEQAAKIKQILLNTVKEAETQILKAKDEEVYVFSFDFFRRF